MESFSGNTEESAEDVPGRKKSKLKALKSRLFGRSKRAGGEGNAKLSQSVGDIAAGKGLGSDEDLVCSRGTMGSRAFSHDSIFLAEQVLTDAEPARVLSQENVHSKIKALQIKLQQQKMHFGPPPMVLPIRRPDYVGDHSEHSPSDISGGDVTSHGTLTKTISQPTSQSLSPAPKLAPTKSLPPTPSHSFSLSVPSNSLPPSVEAPLDFSTPAQFNPCLDTSAARHRMSVKPRNQRASTKKKLDVAKAHTDTLNNIDHPEFEKEQEQPLCVQEEVTMKAEEGRINIPVASHISPPSKPAEVAPVTLEAAARLSSLSFPQQDLAPPVAVAPVPSLNFRVRPHRRGGPVSSERPHSSFIESELKDKREGEVRVTFQNKRNTLDKAEASPDQIPTTFTSIAPFRSSSLRQQVQVEGESMRGFKRPAPGSGSFHLSINTSKSQDTERPRSGSFVGVLEQTETKNKTIRVTEEKSLKEREELTSVQLKASPFPLRRLGQEAAPPITPAVPWERKDSLKKTEPGTPSKSVPTGPVEGGELESSQEEVEEAVEAKEVQEEDGKLAFGVKLRSTSQSFRLQSDTTSNRQAKTVDQKRLKISDNASCASERLQGNVFGTMSTAEDVRPTDPIPPGFHVPVKHNATFNNSPHVMPAEVPTDSSNPKEAESKPQEPQPAPQTAPSEVSWMSLALEKTRSLQQLFTSRFPRDITNNVQTNVQPAGRAQAQVQPAGQAETGAQVPTRTVKTQQSATHVQAANQQPGDTVKAETVRSQVQMVKASPVAAEQKMSVTVSVQSNTFREPQMSRQTSEDQPYTSQSVSQPVSQTVRTIPWTTQSPLRSSSQTETASQFAQGNTAPSLAQSYLSSGQQQSPWSNRGLHAAIQLKSATSASTSVSTVAATAAPPSASVAGSGEREATVHKEIISTRRAVWAGSVSERAAFLEKRTEEAVPPGPKGVELRKAPTEMQAPDEAPALSKTPPQSKDTMPEGRQGVKLAESSPTKVPERPREEKWLRKNPAAPSSPSSSPTLPSVLQSMSDSGQPSWMELAKRKSMAWSDKTMD